MTARWELHDARSETPEQYQVRRSAEVAQQLVPAVDPRVLLAVAVGVAIGKVVVEELRRRGL